MGSYCMYCTCTYIPKYLFEKKRKMDELEEIGKRKEKMCLLELGSQFRLGRYSSLLLIGIYESLANCQYGFNFPLSIGMFRSHTVSRFAFRPSIGIHPINLSV